MSEKSKLGPGGRFFCKSNPEELKLKKDIENAFSEDYTTSMDFLGGKERLNFKKGGEIKIKHPGALHKEMGIPMDEKIPMKALRKEKSIAKKDGDAQSSKRVNFAINFRKGK